MLHFSLRVGMKRETVTGILEIIEGEEYSFRGRTSTLTITIFPQAGRMIHGASKTLLAELVLS